jgi:DNA-binding CsgD family transcriptional regulator
LNGCIEQGHAVPAAPLIVQHKNSRLTIEFSRAERGGENLLLLEETPITEPAPVHMANYNLTPREADVLTWVAQGKTNRDVGDILGMSPRTVNKHLEHIYVKLGVETRSAAAAFLMSRKHGAAEAALAAQHQFSAFHAA